LAKTYTLRIRNVLEGVVVVAVVVECVVCVVVASLLEDERQAMTTR